jgi:acyl carrier protein
MAACREFGLRVSSLDQRLAELGIDVDSTDRLALDSLGRYELWLLLEEVTGREVPLELVASIETAKDVHRWLTYLRTTS